MKTIPLTQGYEAIVDDEDYERLMQFKWCASISRYHEDSNLDRVYAISSTGMNGRQIRMHHLLLTKISGLDIDHVDGNGLNNTRKNLRYATRAQNIANSQERGGRSKYRGVDFNSNMWRVRIGKEGKCIGYFKNEIEAAKAYDEAAKERYGEFARLNFPSEG